MNRQLIILAVQLGQQAYMAHLDLERWREPKLTDKERVDMGLKLSGAITEQEQWATAVLDVLEEEST